VPSLTTSSKLSTGNFSCILFGADTSHGYFDSYLKLEFPSRERASGKGYQIL
jgi:hypothetical protein